MGEGGGGASAGGRRGHSDDPELTALVGELALQSPEFARLWERYDICEHGGRQGFRHSLVGPMTLTYEVMLLARTGGQRKVVYQAAPGTPDERAMLRLDSADTRPESAPSGHPELAVEPCAPAGMLSPAHASAD